MKRLVLLIAFLVLGIVGYLFAWNWAVLSVTNTQISGPGEKAAKIRNRHFIVLAAPEKFSLEEYEDVITWIFAEMKIRLRVVFFIWSILAFSLWYYTFWKNNQKLEIKE